MRYKIYQDTELINTIIADEDFVISYCEEYGYTYDEDPLSVDEPNPESDSESKEFDVWDDMAEAIKEGVNNV